MVSMSLTKTKRRADHGVLNKWRGPKCGQVFKRNAKASLDVLPVFCPLNFPF